MAAIQVVHKLLLICVYTESWMPLPAYLTINRLHKSGINFNINSINCIQCKMYVLQINQSILQNNEHTCDRRDNGYTWFIGLSLLSHRRQNIHSANWNENPFPSKRKNIFLVFVAWIQPRWLLNPGSHIYPFTLLIVAVSQWNFRSIYT